MTELTTMSEHTIVMERVLDAPQELVWRVWTDPDEVTRWWGPEGFTAPREGIEMDPRPGGVCRITMVGPDGQEYRNDGHFLVFEPPSRLSFGGSVPDNPMMESGETTVELVALDERTTKVVVTSRMVCVEALLDMAKAGWGQQLDKLERLVPDA